MRDFGLDGQSPITEASTLMSARIASQQDVPEKVLVASSKMLPSAYRLESSATALALSVAGIGSVITTAVVASIGDISRFSSPEKLASYFGLTLRVHPNNGNAVRRAVVSEGSGKVIKSSTNLTVVFWILQLFRVFRLIRRQLAHMRRKARKPVTPRRHGRQT